MKKIIAIVMVLSLLMCGLASAETVKLGYTGGSLNLRTKATTNSANNGYVKNGDEITVLEKGSVWSKIKTSDGRVGYIKNLYISGNGTGYADGTTYYGGTYNGKVKTKYADSTVNLRAGAGSGYTSIGKIKNGQSLKILGENGSWYLVETTDGTQGFMSKSYVVKSGSTKTVTATVTGSRVNMRAEANSSSKRVTTLTKGTKVTVLDSSDSKWWKVQYSTYTGYMYSAYLKK